MAKPKSEQILRRIIIGFFIFFLGVSILFALFIDAPMLPSQNQESYMIESDGLRVSCLFPIAGSCDKKDMRE